MVALTGAVVATVATAGAAGPAVLAAGSAATGTLAGGAAAAVGGSVAAGTGAAAAAGAAGGAAVTSIGAGILAGPVGWIVLGAAETPSPAMYTFDCWKQVLHDESFEPSNGKTLHEIVSDARIKEVTTTNNHDSELPQLVLKNIWDEQFRIDYVQLQSNQTAAHAVKM